MTNTAFISGNPRLWLLIDANHLLVKGSNLFPKGERWLTPISSYQATNGRLSRPALLSNFGLGQAAKLLNFSNDFFPHATMITQLRYLEALLRYFFAVVSRDGY